MKAKILPKNKTMATMMALIVPRDRVVGACWRCGAPGVVDDIGGMISSIMLEMDICSKAVEQEGPSTSSCTGFH